MQHRQFEHGHFIRFECGEKVQETFRGLLDEWGVEWGHFFAIGALESVELGFYPLATKEWVMLSFVEPLEVCSWSGNVSILEGRPFAHTHAVLGREDGSTVGGHVFEATVGVTLELVLMVLPGRLERVTDPLVGLPLLHMSDATQERFPSSEAATALTVPEPGSSVMARSTAGPLGGSVAATEGVTPVGSGAPADENLGREKLPWSRELWDRLDQAVHGEGKRTWVARRYVPQVPGAAHVLTVPADTVVGQDKDILSVHAAAVTPLIELWVEFSLTMQQVEHESALGTAVTLATRAANILAQAEDTLLYQGDAGLRASELFTQGLVHVRDGPGPDGLTTAEGLENVRVPLSDPAAGRYGEESFTAVEDAYARLQRRGHYGPYAIVFPTRPYADAHAPLKATLIMPADRIRPLVDGNFFGTGTVPKLIGVMQSVGGNTVDLFVGRDATIGFQQVDQDGLYRFRVFERLALRDKDPTGRVILTFDGVPQGAPDAHPEQGGPDAQPEQ